MSPMERTIAKLKSQHIIYGVVERYIAEKNIRIDLFGCFDLIALKPEAITGIQVCGAGQRLQHLRKFYTQKHKLKTWLSLGGRAELWVWTPHKMFRGSKAVRYSLTIDEVVL